MNSRIIISAILFFIYFESVASSKSYVLPKARCNEEEQKKIDYIMAKIAVIGPNGRKLPENMGEMKKFCKESKNLIHKVEKFFKDCYIREVRTYANLAVYHFKHQMRKYCQKSSPKTIKKWLKLAPCANKQILTKDNVCTKRFIEKTTNLINLKNDKDKIRYACCNYVQGYRCARSFLDKVTCLKSNVDEMFEMFQSQSSSNLETFCGDYVQSTDACERLPQLNDNDFYDRKVDKHYVTPVFLLIDLLESMNNYTAPSFDL